MTPTNNLTHFDEFSFDANRLALYHNGKLIRTADKKLLEVFEVLVQRAGELVSYEEIISRVWPDNRHGANSARVNQYIYRLDKLFGEYGAESEYFENVRGRGYIFKGEVREVADGISGKSDIAESVAASALISNEIPESVVQRPSRSMILQLCVAGILLILVGVAAWVSLPRDNDEESIRRVVMDSQMYESMVLYKNPTSYVESDLDKYWTPELQTNVNYDRVRIRDAVKKMVDEGRRYGAESKFEQFDFQAIDINKDGDTAIVKTLEKWFVAVYQDDGTLLKNRTIGPYFVSYILKRIDGRWLIEKSTTARANRPMPRLHSVEPITEVIAGTQFLVRLNGVDFEGETILVEVVGPGCPDVKPCKVPNAILRENSKLTDVAIDNVPLTLTSGEFKLTVRNGDSQASEAIALKVPSGEN